MYVAISLDHRRYITSLRLSLKENPPLYNSYWYSIPIAVDLRRYREISNHPYDPRHSDKDYTSLKITYCIREEQVSHHLIITLSSNQSELLRHCMTPKQRKTILHYIIWKSIHYKSSCTSLRVKIRRPESLSSELYLEIK